jgi:hypothetical protein
MDLEIASKKIVQGRVAIPLWGSQPPEVFIGTGA